MLINLSIENIAVIEKAAVDFSPGFNVLTGETGAGKSLLIDSLSMVLGMRTSRDLIRHGADYALVTALFSSCPDLSDLDISPEEDGCILLSRKLYSDGRNICKINGAACPLSVLKAAGERLVAIHGQHDSISLLKPSCHLSILDEYAQNNNEYDSYKKAYGNYKNLREQLDSMISTESKQQEIKDDLIFKTEEIKKVSPQRGEDEILIEKRNTLRNYSSVMEFLQSASQALSSSGGGKDNLYAAMQSIASASAMDKTLASFSERISEIYYLTEDFASELNSHISRMSYSPYELDETEERLDEITHLKKKYGPDLDSVINNYEQWTKDLESLSSFGENLARLEQEVKYAEDQMIAQGNILQQSRQNAADKLSSSIVDELSFLDMPKVSFLVSFTEHAPNSRGLFDAEFLISTNPSEKPKPLSRIASGGEMSRIMLSLKSALSQCDDVNVLIFDEIDTGVSGRAALKIAQKLRSLSQKRQVLCITHLPQMAAKAHNHILILKNTEKESFTTDVITLDRSGRIDEITRLISGDGSSSATRLAAEEMLE